MKVKLRIHKHGAALCEGSYDVSAAGGFGNACSDAGTKLQEQRLATASSIGALFEELDERLLDELYGAEISLSKA